MKIYIITFVMLNCLLTTNFATAEPKPGKGWKKNEVKENYNKNKQSDGYSTRGQDRADQRHDIKSDKKLLKQYKHRDGREYYVEDDRKIHEKDGYQPFNGKRILEQEIDNAHRRAIDSISEKTKPSSAW